MKVLQFIFGICVGWGLLFSGLMQMSEIPWYQTAMMLIGGLVLFAIGLRPIFGKGTVRVVTLAYLGSFLFYAIFFEINSNSTLKAIFGLLVFLVIGWFLYRIIKTIVNKVQIYLLQRKIRSLHKKVYQDKE